MTFPKVYACNLNQWLTKSGMVVLGINTTDSKEVLVMNVWGLNGGNVAKNKEDMATFKVLQQKFNQFAQSGAEDMFDLIQGCSDMIIKAKWNNSPLKLFMNATLETTEVGACCSLNPHWPRFEFYQDVESMDKDKMHISNGLHNGLMLTLDLEKFDFFKIIDSTGFKIGLSHPQDTSFKRNADFNIPSGALTEVAMIPTMIDTTKEAIDKFEPEERNCYTDEEFGLRFTNTENNDNLPKRYSMENCLYDAFIQGLIDNCNCTIEGMNASLHFCGDDYLEESECYYDMVRKIGSEGMDFAIDTKSGKSKKCLGRCKTQHNNIVPTFLSYPNDNFYVFKYHFETCLIMTKLTKICNNPIKRIIFEEYYADEDVDCQELIDFHSKNNGTCDGYSYFRPNMDSKNDTKVMKFYQRYAKENFAKVAIYFRDPYYTKIVRDVKITFTTFICNAGGLVGLCLGLSFISLFELFYHILKFIFDF